MRVRRKTRGYASHLDNNTIYSLNCRGIPQVELELLTLTDLLKNYNAGLLLL